MTTNNIEIVQCVKKYSRKDGKYQTSVSPKEEKVKEETKISWIFKIKPSDVADPDADA